MSEENGAPSKENGWSRSEMFVMKELKRLADAADETNTTLAQVNATLSALQVKASLWGGLSGAIGGALMALFYVLVRK